VIAAAEHVALHDAHAQRYLAMSAPVLQCVDCAAVAAVQRDPLTCERGGERLFLPHIPRYSDRVPEIRIDPDTPKISGGSGTVIARATQTSLRFGRHRLIVCRKCFRHALLPLRAAYLIQAAEE
jgi:hypothetical protein